MKKLFVGGSLLLLTPMIVLAQDLGSILETITDLVSAATPIIVALALLFFFWGLALYILNAGNEEKKAQGRSIMLWGVIAIFVILSVFGLVAVLQNTFGIQQGETITPGTAGAPGIQ